MYKRQGHIFLHGGGTFRGEFVYYFEVVLHDVFLEFYTQFSALSLIHIYSLMNHYYDMGADKLAYAGMDDAGEMSSWYVLNAIGPVSYTHLDVYKRQVCGEHGLQPDVQCRPYVER